MLFQFKLHLRLTVAVPELGHWVVGPGLIAQPHTLDVSILRTHRFSYVILAIIAESKMRLYQINCIINASTPIGLDNP